MITQHPSTTKAIERRAQRMADALPETFSRAQREQAKAAFVRQLREAKK